MLWYPAVNLIYFEKRIGFVEVRIRYRHSDVLIMSSDRTPDVIFRIDAVFVVRMFEGCIIHGPG